MKRWRYYENSSHLAFPLHLVLWYRMDDGNPCGRKKAAAGVERDAYVYKNSSVLIPGKAWLILDEGSSTDKAMLVVREDQLPKEMRP